MASYPGQALGNLNPHGTAFLCCDIQEKFRPVIQHFSDIVVVADRLVQTSKILGVPLIVTEQYPKGLGHTVEELDVGHARGIFPKTKFSMVIPEVEEQLGKLQTLIAVVLFGIEHSFISYFLTFEKMRDAYQPDHSEWIKTSKNISAHVCIQQTALDLLARGLDVHIVADATSSRSMLDRQFAYERMRQAGAVITTSESIIFQLLGSKDNPKFKEVQALVRTSAPTSGLVSGL